MTMRLREYLSIRDAAQFLGVSTETLRNWDRLGQFRALRHPINNYRLYRTEDLSALLEKIKHKVPQRYEENGDPRKLG